MPATVPAPPAPPDLPAPVAPPSLLDDLFGGFWPDRGVPARVSVLAGAVGVGVLAAMVLPFRDLGIGTRWCCSSPAVSC